MAASSFPMPLLSSRPQNPSRNISANPSLTHILRARERGWVNRRISLIRTHPTFAIDGGTTFNHAAVEISWQIAVGALAGAMPFVVAGIEFGKRIVAQRRCGTCGGSGLVQRDECYFRCPTCGIIYVQIKMANGTVWQLCKVGHILRLKRTWSQLDNFMKDIIQHSKLSLGRN